MARPQVVRTADPIEIKETPAQRRKRLLALGVVGVGGASALGALAIAGPSGANQLKQFSDEAKSWKDASKDPREMTKDYAILGSKALNAVNLPANKIVELYRRSPLSPTPWYPSSGNHYREFQRGPVFGYLQLAREASDTSDVTPYAEGMRASMGGMSKAFKDFHNTGKLTYEPWLIDPTINDEGAKSGDPKVLAHMKEYGTKLEDIPVGGTQRFNKHLTNIFSEIRDRIGGQSNGGGLDMLKVFTSLGANPVKPNLPTQTSVNFEPFSTEDRVPRLEKALSATANHLFGQADLSKLTQDQQERVVRESDSFLKESDPTTWAAKQIHDTALGSGKYTAGGFYPKYIDKVLPTRSVMLYAGLTIAAVGGLALLNNWLDKKKREQRLQEKQDNIIQMPERFRKAAQEMIKASYDGVNRYPVVSTNAPLLKGMGGPPDRYSSSPLGARLVSEKSFAALGNFVKKKSIKKADGAENDYQNGGDLVYDIARVLEQKQDRTPDKPSEPSISQDKPSEPGKSEAKPAEPSISQAKTAGLDPDREKLPFRKRVEVYAMKDGKVHGGTYKDGGFGVYGGGLDDEKITDAAEREYAEESGLGVKNLKLIPVEPVKLDWVPPYKSEKQARRAKDFRGSQTFFMVGDLDDSNPQPKAKGDDGKSLLQEPRLHDIDEAIAKCKAAKPSEEGVRLINDTRIQVLNKLKEQMSKTADVAQFLPRKEVITFTPSGKIAIKRTINRRFDLPSDVEGQPVPYESPTQLLPEGGAPEKGIHGYSVALHSADADLPEGFEEIDPQEALKELYAAMGKPENRVYQGLDRARARALLRLLKRRTPSVATPG